MVKYIFSETQSGSGIKHTAIFFLHGGVANKKGFCQKVRYRDYCLGGVRQALKCLHCCFWPPGMALAFSPLSVPWSRPPSAGLLAQTPHALTHASIGQLLLLQHQIQAGFSFLLCWFSNIYNQWLPRTCSDPPMLRKGLGSHSPESWGPRL